MWVKVQGLSMWPVLKTGDRILSIPITSDMKLKLGDIVLVKKNGTRFVHRIVTIEASSYFTRGDTQNISEGPFSVTDLEGLVIIGYRGDQLLDLHRFRYKLYGVMQSHVIRKFFSVPYCYKISQWSGNQLYNLYIKYNRWHNGFFTS